LNTGDSLKRTLIVIAGPTAIGKTALAIELAQRLNTEIISADSRQFYREMNIGTAKPSANELAFAPHHLINFLSIHDEYNAGRFEEDALKSIEQIFFKKETAILCGGSGLYIDIVCKGADKLPSRNSEIRNELNKLYQESGIEELQKRLADLDPEFYNQVDQNNPHRLIRALEVCILTGKKYSELRKGKKQQRPFNIIKIGLEDEREKVYQRINERVDEMMKQGLLEEAKTLYPHRHLNALQTVGYKELFDYLDNKTSLEEAINLIKQHTRNYAKRQWTWFRKDKEIHWFGSIQFEEITMFLDNKGIKKSLGSGA